MRLPQRLWAIVSIATIAGCQGDAPTAGTNPDLTLLPVVRVDAQQHRNFDDRLAMLAEELPGFGGLFFDSTGQLIIRLKDQSLLDSFKPRITQFLTRDAGGNAAFVAERMEQVAAARAQEAQYDFRQLHTWYQQVVAIAGGAEGVTMGDIDEVRNRVVVGVANSSRIASMEEAVARLGIPSGVVIVEQFDPVEIHQSQQSLRDRTRPVIAAVEISSGLGICTLGYNVAHWFNEEYQEEYFVTNSHCTTVFGQVTGMSMGQAVSTDIIGTESVDPPLFTNSSDPRCPAGRQCRYSDAALFLYNEASFSHGIVAWPDVGSIDYSNIRVITGGGDPIVGMTVHKVGRTTGHTTGVVSETCIDVPQFSGGFDTGRTMLCQVRGNYNSAGGDSGSPVVDIFPDGTLVNRGIHWGSGGIFSMGNEWLRELREPLGVGHGLCTTASCLPPPPPPPPSMTATISGPTTVRPGAVCTWLANVQGGSPPYGYAWWRDGQLVSTSSEYVGAAAPMSFYLQLNVYEQQGTLSDTDAMTVVTSSKANPCLE